MSRDLYNYRWPGASIRPLVVFTIHGLSVAAREFIDALAVDLASVARGCGAGVVAS